jgi:hypothetical protein
MSRFHQLLFSVSILALCWYGMMAVHELGHVFGAVVTGGSVQRIVLHPLTISRTDVAPNPMPGVVVWLGPITGSVSPLALVWLSRDNRVLRSIAMFFAGFCLIANGAYISIGSFDRIGDCGEMLRTGTPLWTMFAFGAITAPLGIYIWHRIGSLRDFFREPSAVTPRMAYLAFASFAALLVAEFIFSPT